MKHLRKYLLYSLIFLVIIGAGFIGGRYLFNPPPSLTDQQIAEQKQQKTIQQLEKSDYLAAIPSFGPLVQTQTITVQYQDDIATGLLPPEQAAKIKEKQPVILYDQEGYTLPLGGTVTTIQPEAGQTKITISLPEKTNTEFLAPQVNVITLETIASKRLPLAALQKDNNGEYYVWLAYADENAGVRRVKRLSIKPGLSDSFYFEEDGHVIDTYDLIILNPDDKISSDSKYDIFITEMPAPLHNPIKQAWIDFELYRLQKEQDDLTEQAANCRNGLNLETLQPAPATGGGSSCGFTGTTGGAPIDPFQIFNITPENSTAPSCGNNISCGK